MAWFRSKEKQTGEVNFTAMGGKFATFLSLNGTMLSLPTELSDSNAFELATKVAEIYIPIDLVAGKVQKLMRTIHCVDEKGNEVKTPTNVKKILESPNPYYTMSDIYYNAILSIMSDGNRYLYSHSPSEKITQDNITGLFLLQPDAVQIEYKSDKSKYFDAVQLSDMIKCYRYDVTTKPISPERIRHDRYSFITGTKDFSIKAKSPLYAAQQNVNNTLAAYSARYNVFVNNGSALILCPESQNSAIPTVSDPQTRDAIMEDINSREGLVGNKQIKAISSVPLKAVNTLVSIKDLQPYDECREDMYMIAGIYEIDKDLLPSKEGATFTNKEVAETKLWNDVVIPFTNDLCDSLTYALRLNGIKFAVKTSNEGFLQSNRKTGLEADKIEIENLNALQQAGIDVSEQLKQISLKYGEQK